MVATKLADGSSWPIDVEALQELAHRLRYQATDTTTPVGKPPEAGKEGT